MKVAEPTINEIDCHADKSARNDSVSSLRGSAKRNEAINKKVDCQASLRSVRFDTLTFEQVIKRMSNRFRVSFDAMKRRLVNLGYIEKSKIF